jgi:integrase
VGAFGWWKRIPTVTIAETPQETVTDADYRAVLARAHSPRDKALIATLWATGCRRSELVAMSIEHLDVDAGNVVLPRTKNCRHRVAPLSPEAGSSSTATSGAEAGAAVDGQGGPSTSDGARLPLARLQAP